MPVVRWLQVGAVAAGIGIGMAAASGIAVADDGTASTSDSSASESPGPAASNSSAASDSPAAKDDDAKGAEASAADDADEQEAVEDEATEDEVEPDDEDSSAYRDDPSADDIEETAAEETGVEAVDLAGEEAPHAFSDYSAIAASVEAPATALATLNEPACGCELNQALTGAANWLDLHPRVPFGPFLETGVYLVRRTLFPASVGVITEPVKVKLHFTDTTQSSGENKLGIYLAMAGSTKPVLFEFDTGSAGLFSAYSGNPGVSPWWGNNFEDMGNPAGVTFDSGLVYSGTAASTAVSLYSDKDACASVLSTGQALVGQMTEIGTSTDATAFWDASGSTSGEPPIEGAFYGDFGMALNDREDGIVNLISQLTFGWGVKSGFVVHVDPITKEAWLQIGLTRSDLNNDDTMFFYMDPDPDAPATARFPNSHLRYYALQPFTATLSITDGEQIELSVNDAFVPILPDTGASTTLHNTQSSPNPVTYIEFTDWTDEFTKGKLNTGLNFSLSGTTTSGQLVTFFEFVTSESTDGGRVGVQNEASVAPPGPTPPKDMYYLNSGRSMFNEYDLVYSLGNPWGGGVIGLLPHGVQSSKRSSR